LPLTAAGPPTLIFYSHYSHGTHGDRFPPNAGKELRALLFVDGHAIYRNFTRFITANTTFLAEPTAEWVWYKPK